MLFMEIHKGAHPSDLEVETLFKQPVVGLEVFRMKEKTFLVASYSNRAEAKAVLKSSAGKL